MSKYEIFSVTLSSLAIIVSIIIWIRQSLLQQRSLDMQKATADLSKKQLEILIKEDKEKSSARLKLELLRHVNGYKFVIENISEVDAADVNMELLIDNSKKSPLIQSDVSSKLPAPKLAPHNKIRLIAGINLGSPTAYNARLTWSNPDGEQVVYDTYVSI